ncbi:MAG: signal peptidase II [Rhodothermales bacterium]|nr:signal peptidase II [Rhodothermales bacterium]
MRILWLSGLVVLLDQVTKIVVLQTMYRSQTIPLIGDWLSLTYTENPGMAFGITFGPPALITYFSIFATLIIIIYLFRIRRGYGPYRFSLALVLGGALGNIIDRVFYGAIFYGEPLFQGRVVDFIHVNVWRGYLPESIPLLGGKYFALFPIWNVADMSIVLGVVGILFFQKAFHHRQELAAAVDGEKSTDSSMADGSASDGPSDAHTASVETVASEAPLNPTEAESPRSSSPPPSKPQA